MASTATPVSLEEYLHTTYDPDRDFLEGELVERNMGEQTHGQIQGIINGIFRDNRKLWRTRTTPELRVQVRPNRFRIPDVCVVWHDDPFEERITKPPLVCIEVLSTDQSLGDVRDRIDDYFAMGVNNVWVIDPRRRIGYVASERSYLEKKDGFFTVPGTPVVISLAEVFEEYDENFPRS